MKTATLLKVQHVEALEKRCLLSAGELDSTFGTGGIWVPQADTPPSFLLPTDLAVAPDAKLLFTGVGLTDVGSVVRLTASGTVDTSFGVEGLARSGFGPYTSLPNAVAIGPQGKIAVAGFAGPFQQELPNQATLVVYDSSGKLDTSFDGDGVLNAPQFSRGFTDVAFQSDGKILALGEKLVRYNPDGTLDKSFGGGDGIADVSGKELLIDSAGNIDVLGYFALLRLTPQGNLDTSFNGNGVVPSVKGSDFALAPDGDILVAGNGTSANLVTRFNSSGSLDKSFGSNGSVTFFGSNQIAVTDSDIYVGGTAAQTPLPYNQLEIRAFTQSGQTDTSWGNNGSVLTPISATRTRLVDLGIQSGKLVALASVEQPLPSGGTTQVPAIARYQTTPSTPTGQQPFGGTPASLPGTLEFENFDTGGEGLAYHDTDTINQGGAYRTDTGVDLQTIPSGGVNLGFSKAGEWTEYTVNVQQAGDYDAAVRLASLKGGGTFRFVVDDNQSGSTVVVPSTGDWQKYTTIKVGPIHFTAGTHIIRLAMLSNDSTGYVANFDSAQFSAHAARSPFGGTPIDVPGVIQLENFDNGGEGIAYHDTDAINQGGAYRNTGVDIEGIAADKGGGYALDFFKAGEWTEYTFNVPPGQAGVYQLFFWIASLKGNGVFRAQIDGKSISSPIGINSTGDWQTFHDYSTDFVDLTAGTHVLRLTGWQNDSTGYVGNFDRVEFKRHRDYFNGNPFSPSSIIQAEDFDIGGEGATYHDTEPANLGGAYRPSEGVDIEAIPGGGYNVGYAKAGEWLEYSVYNPTSDVALSNLEMHVASLRAGGKFHVEVDGAQQLAFTVSDTGSWQTYTVIGNLQPLNFSPGMHRLRLVMDQNNSTGYVANFDYLQLVPW